MSETNELKYKDGDRGRFAFHAQTTDKLLIFATNGRFYTLSAEKLPGGRGHGDPVRLLMIDLPNDQDIIALFVHQPGKRIVVASSDGRGFIISEDDVIADEERQTGAQCWKRNGGAGLCPRGEVIHLR